MTSIQVGGITALVLAGGRATRMGGVDKGLQLLNGTPLALHALQRLLSVPHPLLAVCAINANRHVETYARWGFAVWPDSEPGQPGPLAGMLTGLERSQTTHLLTLPCDAPCFPGDLVERLAAAFGQPDTDIAVATAPDEDGVLRRQPVFALMHVKLADRLAAYIQRGGRKVGHWMSEQHVVDVPFDRPGDDPGAFVNLNTLDSLHAMASRNVPHLP